MFKRKKVSLPINKEVLKDIIFGTLAAQHVVRKKTIDTDILDKCAMDTLILLGHKYDILPPAFYEQVENTSDFGAALADHITSQMEPRIKEDSRGNRYKCKQASDIMSNEAKDTIGVMI
jgi:hypothetical protein